MIKKTLLALLLSSAAVFAADSYLTEIEDVPLPPGLSELPGGLLFDSADGRIVETAAKGEISEHELRRFYDDSLTQLGWEKTGDLEFRRDNEILRLRLDGTSTIRFTLAPAH